MLKSAIETMLYSALLRTSLLSWTHIPCRFPRFREIPETGSQQTPCTAKTKEARLVRTFFVLMLTQASSPRKNRQARVRRTARTRRFGRALARPQGRRPVLSSCRRPATSKSSRAFPVALCSAQRIAARKWYTIAESPRTTASLRAPRAGLRRSARSTYNDGRATQLGQSRPAETDSRGREM
ncbi:MAG: hypothetical protein ACI9DC_005484 [Gammaproteobacteria bacterium]|jgi:hypothetical protein